MFIRIIKFLGKNIKSFVFRIRKLIKIKLKRLLRNAQFSITRKTNSFKKYWNLR